MEPSLDSHHLLRQTSQCNQVERHLEPRWGTPQRTVEAPIKLVRHGECDATCELKALLVGTLISADNGSSVTQPPNGFHRPACASRWGRQDMRRHPWKETSSQPHIAGEPLPVLPMLGKQRNTKRIELCELTEPARARHEKIGVRHDRHGIQYVRPTMPVHSVALQCGIPLALLVSPLVGRPASLSHHMEVHGCARDLC
eukprot:scaffold26037_cov73-Phaeocystis_antarctica.AAC.5